MQAAAVRTTLRDVTRLVLPDVSVATWSAFHAGDVGALAPELVDCWSRARALGAPVDGAPAEELLVRGDALRDHADPIEAIQVLGDAVLDRTTARLAERDYLMLVADAAGVVVHTRGGGGFAEVARRVRLIEGACWSEAARGTNAIGTAVAANRPTEVHGHAHFGRPYHELVCYAAPVRGLDGLPLAIIDATSRVERADPDIARAVIGAARALEELVRLRAYAGAGQSVMRVLGRSLDRLRDPAVLVEAPGLVARANPAARELLGAAIAGRDVAGAVGVDWRALVAEALAPAAGGRPIVVGRRAWRLRAEPIAAPGGQILAVLAILEPGRALAPAAARAPVAEPFTAIFAEDAGVAAAVRWCRQLAASDLPIMLLAETGAGKELFAQAVHAASPRADGPWHAVNCGALAPGVLEAELFGYAPGAFTGAERTGRTGLFHAAAGGTLFLDEVAEMSPAMQAALLRVVETGSFRRVGDVRLERTDVRLVCATCRDLGALVASGAFRRDLYYRLKGASVRIPPLRERTDVLALAEHLLGGAAALAPDAAAAIARYGWPGNVRELKSVLAVARVAAGGAAVLEALHLPEELVAEAPPPAALDDAERDALVRALAEAGGNVSRAARALGAARSTVYRMMRRHRLG